MNFKKPKKREPKKFVPDGDSFLQIDPANDLIIAKDQEDLPGKKANYQGQLNYITKTR